MGYPLNVLLNRAPEPSRQHEEMSEMGAAAEAAEARFLSEYDVGQFSNEDVVGLSMASNEERIFHGLKGRRHLRWNGKIGYPIKWPRGLGNQNPALVWNSRTDVRHFLALPRLLSGIQFRY